MTSGGCSNSALVPRGNRYVETGLLPERGHDMVLRRGHGLTDAERDIRDRGLVSLICQHHDAIDTAAACTDYNLNIS